MLHKVSILICSCLLVIISGGLAFSSSQTPMSAGGITLGTPIDGYNLTRHQNFVEEVIVTGIKGFRKGFITYGTCARPGEVLRIRLKYYEKSYDYFEELLKQFKVKFGSRPKFIGDSFGHVKAWKWAFTNDDGKRVSLILQHNLKDPDESTGNTVKLGLPDQLIAERECSNKIKFQGQEEGGSSEGLSSDWQILLPN